MIGSPFGEEQEQSLSVGVVAALNREIDAPATDFTTPGVIQTDAAINHGNSGGPVLDRGGRVVGVASQILTDGNDDAWTGIGFAVPAEAAQRSLRGARRQGAGQLRLARRRHPAAQPRAGADVQAAGQRGPARERRHARAARPPPPGCPRARKTAELPGRRARCIRTATSSSRSTASRCARRPSWGPLVALAEPGSVVPVEIYRGRQAAHGPGDARQPPRAAPGVGSLLYAPRPCAPRADDW